MGIEILSVTRAQATAIAPAIRVNTTAYSQTVRVRSSAAAFLRLVANDPGKPVEVSDEDYPLFAGGSEYFHVNAGERLVVGAAAATVEFVLVNAHGSLPTGSVSNGSGGGGSGPVSWDDIAGKPPGMEEAPANAELALLLASALGKFVFATQIYEMTPEQAEEVTAGVTVVTDDGMRWVYKGTGDKLIAANYLDVSDMTPEWATVAGRPEPLIERFIAGAMRVPVATTIDTANIPIPGAVYDELTEGVFVIAPPEAGGGRRLWRYVGGPSNVEASYLNLGPVESIEGNRISFLRAQSIWFEFGTLLARPRDPFGGGFKAPISFDIPRMNLAGLIADDPEGLVETVTVEVGGPEFFGSLDDFIERGNIAAMALGLPSDTFSIAGANLRDLAIRSGPLSTKLMTVPYPTEIGGGMSFPHSTIIVGPHDTLIDFGMVRTSDNGAVVSAQSVVENLQAEVRKLRRAVVAPASPYVLHETPGLSREPFTIVPGTELAEGNFIVNGTYGFFGNLPEGTDLSGRDIFCQGIFFVAQAGQTVEQTFEAMKTEYAAFLHIDYDPATGAFEIMSKYLSAFNVLGTLPIAMGIAPDPSPVNAIFVSTNAFGTFVWSKLSAFPTPPDVDVDAIFPAYRYGCVVEYDGVSGVGTVVSRNAVLAYENFVSQFPVTGGRMFAGGVLERRNVVVDGMRFL